MRRIDRLAKELMDKLENVVEEFLIDNPDGFMLGVRIDVDAPPKAKKGKKAGK